MWFCTHLAAAVIARWHSLSTGQSEMGGFDSGLLCACLLCVLKMGKSHMHSFSAQGKIS